MGTIETTEPHIRCVASLALGVALLGTPRPAEAGQWRLQAALGGAWSFGSTLTVTPAGAGSFEVPASWDNRNLESPLYYGLAVGYDAWSVRLVHLKVFLANPPSRIDRFSVSHGYNLLTLERSFSLGELRLLAGIGLVAAHPEARLAPLLEPEADPDPGYDLTGPTAALALVRPIDLGTRFALVPEVRLSLSRARVDFGQGEASVPNASLHLLLGLELRL